MDATPTIIAVKFKGGDKTYDYLCRFPIAVGQRVYVPTRNGGKTKAEVVQIRPISAALGTVEEEPQEQNQ